MSTIKLKGSSSGEAEVTVAAAAGTPTFTLPTTVGSANQLLKNSGTAGTLEYSSNLTFDGTHLTLGTATSNASDVFTIVDPGNVFMSIRSDAQADGNNQVLDFGVGTGNRASGNIVSSIAGVVPSGATAGGTLKGYLSFSTNSGDSLTERLKITETGNVTVSDGDLVIGTAGHGIDFSANSHATGMTSETFNSYEEGSFTPAISAESGSVTSYYNQEGKYTKVGRLVTCLFRVRVNNAGNASGDMKISGLPFTVGDTLSSTSLDGTGGPTYWGSQDTDIVQMTLSPIGSSTTAYVYVATGATSSLTNLRHDNAFGNNWDIRAWFTYFV